MVKTCLSTPVEERMVLRRDVNCNLLIISYEGCNTWKDCSDPAEQEGKVRSSIIFVISV